MEAAPEQPLKNPEAIVPLGSTQSEVDAHLLADALRTAGIDARVMDAHAGGALPFTTLFPASILVHAGDYADARELIGRIMPEGRQLALPERCPVCRYSTEGLGEDPVCPECGAPLDRLARIDRDFRYAPPPAEVAGVQRVVAVLVVLFLIIVVGTVLVMSTTGWIGNL